MKIVKQSWAKKSDLENYKDLNRKLGYFEPSYQKELSWSRQWEYGWVREFLLTLPKESSLLDIGVTPATRFNVLMEGLESFIVHTCDIYDHKNIVNFTKCNIGDSTYKDEQFDNVMSISSIEHDADPVKCLKEMFRITKTGGHVILTIDYGGGNTAWPITTKALMGITEFLGIKGFISYPQDIIKSEDFSTIGGIRVLGLIIQK